MVQWHRSFLPFVCFFFFFCGAATDGPSPKKGSPFFSRVTEQLSFGPVLVMVPKGEAFVSRSFGQLSWTPQGNGFSEAWPVILLAGTPAIFGVVLRRNHLRKADAMLHGTSEFSTAVPPGSGGRCQDFCTLTSSQKWAIPQHICQDMSRYSTWN